MQSHIFKKLQLIDFSCLHITIHGWFNYFCAFSLIVLSLVAMPGLANTKNTPVPHNKLSPKPTILVFGDSLSASYGITQDQGWVSLLMQRLVQQNYNYKVINLSISGETTSGGLSRFKQAVTLHKPRIVILELGANDGLRGLNAADTYKNLDSMITQAKPANVLLLGMKIPPNYGLKYSTDFSDNYAKLAKKHQIKLVPFMLDGIAGNRDLIQQDGLHPTAAAQSKILENSWVVLKKMLVK